MEVPPTSVNLNEDDLSEEAKIMFDYHSSILDATKMCAEAILSNNLMSAAGRFMNAKIVEEYYSAAKSVMNYIAAHPESNANQDSLPPVFFIAGFPRTGSTLLYSLLACDPVSRAPFMDEMVHPIPPIPRSDTTEHSKRLARLAEFPQLLAAFGITNWESKMDASHPKYQWEEDLFPLGQAGLHYLVLLMPHHDNSYFEWLHNNTNKDFAYRYHKRFISMLNSVDAPDSHWVLKTPIHSHFLDTLQCHYPSSRIIMTHRRLDEVVPSFIRLAECYTSGFLDKEHIESEAGRKAMIEYELTLLDACGRAIVEHRKKHPENDIIDIYYEDLMAKPIDTVRYIYERLGLTWSKEFESAMLAWLDENPQGKQGRNSYSLERFGLTCDEIEQRYAEYINMFPKVKVQTD